MVWEREDLPLVVVFFFVFVFFFLLLLLLLLVLPLFFSSFFSSRDGEDLFFCLSFFLFGGMGAVQVRSIAVPPKVKPGENRWAREWKLEGREIYLVSSRSQTFRRVGSSGICAPCCSAGEDEGWGGGGWGERGGCTMKQERRIVEAL